MKESQRMEGEVFISGGKGGSNQSCCSSNSSYIMSCYKLPELIFHEIEAILARFWRGANNGERRIHWLSWDNLSKAKGVGGLGFRSIKEFNSSLLGKHYWRVVVGGRFLGG